MSITVRNVLIMTAVALFAIYVSNKVGFVKNLVK